MANCPRIMPEKKGRAALEAGTAVLQHQALQEPGQQCVECHPRKHRGAVGCHLSGLEAEWVEGWTLPLEPPLIRKSTAPRTAAISGTAAQVRITPEHPLLIQGTGIEATPQVE